METLHSSESINGLVKKLCEKITSKKNEKLSTENLKRLRSRAYEILLHKRLPENVGDSELQNKDSLCRLMAWQFSLAYEYDFLEHSEKIGECIKRIENSPLHRNKVLLDMIEVLLRLKTVPHQNRIQGSKLYSSFKKTSTKQPDHEFSFRSFDERSFHLPPDLYSDFLVSKTSLESMVLKKKSTFIVFVENDSRSSNNPVKNTSSIHTLKKSSSSTNNNNNNELYQQNEQLKNSSITNNNYISLDVLNNDLRNIWEIVSQTKFDKRRTWETLQDPVPEKERPFLPEAHSNISNLIRHMQSSVFADVIAGRQEIEVIEERKISSDEFIADLKLLLVGVSSRSFYLNTDDNSTIFQLNNGFYVDGLSTQVLKSFSVDFLHSASCYVSLNDMCEENVNFRHLPQRGYIFKEICNRINNFLSFYRISISSHANSTNLLKFYSNTEPQRCQVDLIAQACSVGPYINKQHIRPYLEYNVDKSDKAESISDKIDNLSENDAFHDKRDGSMFSGDWKETKDDLHLTVPSGVAMLDHLYTKVTHLSEGPILMAVYAILLPCLELYYSHFLQQWLFHGHFDDPYNEFFIRANPKYIVTKGRIYWTRSYTIQHDLIPMFLTELADDILQCGKAMNLLNITNHKRSNSLYWHEKIPNIRICLNFEQLNKLRQDMNKYHADILSANGKFSATNILRKTLDENIVFLNLIAQKRATTLKRIECQKIMDLERLSQEKLKKMKILQENYEIVKRDKEIHKAEELEREIALNEANLKIQELRDKIIKDEALDMIDHYNKLFAISDKRKESIEKTIKQVRSLKLNLQPTKNSVENLDKIDENASKSSEEDFEILDAQSLGDPEILEIKIPEQKSPKILHTSKSLDFLNANTENNADICPEINDNQIIETLTAAQKNKLKVMSSEYNILAHCEFIKDAPKESGNQNVELTSLQKNRLRVLTSHFDKEEEVIKSIDPPVELTALQKNRLKVLSTEYGLINTMKLDVANKNIPSKNDNEIAASTKSSEDIFFECSSDITLNDNNSASKLNLDFANLDSCKSGPSLFTKFLQSPNFEFSKPIPMSVDTTPMSDVSTIFKSSEFLDIVPSTAATNFTNEEFEFPAKTFNSSTQLILQPITLNDAQNVSNHFLKIFLRDSVAIPLRSQLSLTNNTLLKYIFVDLQYFKHAQSLRDYFFLLDGEFGRNITDILFEALYKCTSPREVINIRFLNSLITEALEFSSKEQTMASALSFKINFIPKIFNLQKVDTLSCISMVYKVPWPLNILFPSDIIGKYDGVFKFLVKLRRVSWVLQKIFMEFKILSKRVGKRFEFLLLSPQYQRLHQFRHVMMHFIQTYENYIVGEVLQSSWFSFQEKLQEIANLDELFDVHFKYIKNIEFMCLLNQKAFKLREAIYGIYTVILKFYEYLRARQWEFLETVFIHPNFEKLEKIYNNFENFVKFVFKASKKVASQGAQPQLLQFVDMLNVNDYYSKKIVDNANLSVDSSTCILTR